MAYSLKSDFAVRSLLLLGVSSAGLVCADAAHAQAAGDPPAAAAPSNSGLQEIVVTAQKREQRLQSVPIAITALTTKSLESNRVQSVTDLSGLAPGFTARQTTGGIGVASFSMRGVTSYGIAPGSDKEVPIYLDGVYLGNPRGAVFDLPDIQRIEVLRGPQGTLFGRNATAGAVSVLTRDPSGTFALRQENTVGNYDQLRNRTTIDLPQMGAFSAYGTYVHDERRGEVRNTGAGTVWDRSGPGTGVGLQVSPKYLGSKNSNTFFGALKFEPSDVFSAVYKFDYSENHFTPEAEEPIAYNPGGAARLFQASLGSVLAPLYAAYFDSIVAGNPVNFASDAKRRNSTNNAWTTPGYQRNIGHSLTMNLRLSDNLSLKNIASYRKTYVQSAQSGDGLDGTVPESALVPFARFVAARTTANFTSLPVATQNAIVSGFAASPAIRTAAGIGQRLVYFAVSNTGKSEQYSDELQANYDAKLLTLTAGAIYYHQQDKSGSYPALQGTSTFAIYPATGVLPLGNQQLYYPKIDSYAAYAQAEVHLTPQLDLVAGGRITRDHKFGRAELGGTYTPSATNPTDRTQGTFTGLTILPFNYKKTRPSYSGTINYHPTDDLLFYAKYSNAFLSGGTVLDFAYKPEVVKSIEGGFKGSFFDRRVRTNIAVWKADYSDYQSAQGGNGVGRPDISVVIADIGKLKAYGFESELNVAPLRNTTVGGSLSYTHNKFSNPPAFLLATTGGEYAQGVLPKWTATAYGEYITDPLIGTAFLDLRVDANWRSKILLQANPNIALQIPVFAAGDDAPPTWIVNTRLSLRNIGKHMDLSVWARNLTNDRSPVFSSGLPYTSEAASFQRARTYGLDVSFRF